MQAQTDTSTILYGSRQQDFVDLIKKVLNKGRLKDTYLNLLTDADSMELYGKAFTAPSADAKNNYEFLEILGDATLNNSIVYYVSRRFPQLNCPEGVKVVARLKINLVSKETFFNIAKDLGFFPFISATEENKGTKMKGLCEDSFEAFFGATVTLLDRKIRMGVGYAIAYTIIASILDEVDISLKYEDLFDAKTRLKELADWNKQFFPITVERRHTKGGQWVHGPVPSLKYVEIQTDESGYKTYAAQRAIPDYQGNLVHYETIGQGSGAKKATAEQAAAQNALINLKRMGIEKPTPETYLLFCEE
jgi:dsRNA-specific ribonuclease